MSSIKIKYDELEESSKYAKKLSGELDDYSNRITRKIKSPVSSLPGNDRNGYASNIAAHASSKIRELNDKSNMFKSYADNVQKFVANAERADKTVEKSIRSTAKAYVGERSKWQAFCDNVYNFLFVECANKYDFVRFLTDAAKSGWSYVTSFTEKAREWFKHGAGKYVWNIVSAVVATVGAIVGAITAVAAVIAGGPVLAVVLAIIAAGAAIVGAVITTINSGVKVYNNVKALNEDDPGVARYVGNIGGVSDAVEKYDMGDAEDNRNWEMAGDYIDTLETTCEVIGIVTSFAKTATELGMVKNVRSGKIEGYKFSKENIKFNIKSKLGFDYDTNKWSFKKMFKHDISKDVTENWFAKNGEGGIEFFNNLMEIGPNRKVKAIKIIANGSSISKTVINAVEDGTKIYNNLKTGINFSSPTDTVESMETIGYTIIDTYGLLGGFKVFGGINGYITKPATNLLELIGIKRPERLA